MDLSSTICAIATPRGRGAISVIRISGKDAFQITDKIFVSKSGKKITELEGNTVVYGNIVDAGRFVDDVLVSIFKNPKSYTGEDSVEISCHGSNFIQQEILSLLTSAGAVLAEKGEFTARAFFNGKLDLLQAEAVADMIDSENQASHALAVSQMRGGFSSEIANLRAKLLDLTSLLELELDFGEEDVEFADRTKLIDLTTEIITKTTALTDSFKTGNAIKKGIPVAIAGKPNAGKSTLLNALLNEERAIVSHIPGTTRDSIEDVMVLNGIPFRFIDTAGIRESSDEIENEGIKRTMKKMEEAQVILYIFDISTDSGKQLYKELSEMKSRVEGGNEKQIILLANKIDYLEKVPGDFKELVDYDTIFISAKRKQNINLIIDALLKEVEPHINQTDVVVSNVRHYDALVKTSEALLRAKEALLVDVSADLVSQDIREALHYMGLIVGAVSDDEILGNIFANFCIGK